MIGDRWGVTTAEIARHYPCDDIVADPAMRAWRGVTVNAPADAVWSWVAQLRVAPYSYDWIDNLGRRSPQELRPLADPVVDEPFLRAAGRPVGRVLNTDIGRHYTGSISGAVISYVVQPEDAATRLLMKIVMARGRVIGPIVLVGDLVMARRQLLNLKRLAEGTAR